MGFMACIQRTADRLDGKLPVEKIEDIATTIVRRAQALEVSNPAKNFDEHAADVAKQMTDDLLYSVAVEKRAALQNMIKRRERRQRYVAIQREGFNIDDAVQATTVGVAKRFDGARYGVAQRQQGLAGDYVGGLMADLIRDDLLRIARSSKFDREIGLEMEQLARKGGKPGLTGSKEALAIARIFHKYNVVSLEGLNKAGAAIRSLDGFVTSQIHDRQRVKRMGFEKWVETILPLLDIEKTFGTSDPVEFLREVYNHIITGKSGKNSGAVTDAPSPFKGFGNLAKQVSHERVLHFKSWDEAHQYNQVAGRGSLMENMINRLERSAHNTVLMQEFGTRPEAEFLEDMRHLQDIYRYDEKQLGNITGWRGGHLQHQFAQIDGSVRIPENVNIAKIGSAIRVVSNIKYLGGVAISAFSDLPNKAATLKYQGHGFFDRWHVTLTDLFKGRGSKERRELGALLGLGFDGTTGAILSRFTGAEYTPGKLTDLQNLFFKATGLNWITDTMKSSTGIFMSHVLARRSNLAWGALDDDMRKVFSLYGIGESEWDVIRQTPVKMQDGNAYITPDGIDDAEIRQKLATYFNDQADYASPTPGAREQAIQNLGLKPGTIEGEALRMIMQFKSFPITMMTKVIGRGVHGDGAANIPAIVSLALSLTVFGYASMTAKDLAKGLEPRRPDDPRAWMAAFLQGGGAGILGDFFFGQMSRHGQNLASTLSGPSIGGWMSDLYGLAYDGGNRKAKAFNMAVDIVPVMNLFYVRSVMNYLWIYQVQETLNPGYLRRMESRRKKEEGREFIFPPRLYAQ
nr:hypothetical protein 1 [bacterium]